MIGAGLLLIPVIPMLGLSRIFPDTELVREKKRELADTMPEVGVKNNNNSNDVEKREVGKICMFYFENV